jgi:hypothetical protein
MPYLLVVNGADHKGGALPEYPGKKSMAGQVHHKKAPILSGIFVLILRTRE